MVETIAELPWPVGTTRVEARYTQEKLGGEVYRIRFGMLRGSMKQYLGQCYIEPWAPGRTAVTRMPAPSSAARAAAPSAKRK